MNNYHEEEHISHYRNQYLVGTNMTPTKNHQAYDELLKLQKILGSEIYIRRIRDRTNF